MKLVCCYSESHEAFLPGFLEIMKLDQLDLILRKLPQDCATGSYQELGWTTAMRRKLFFLLENLQSAKDGEALIFSDIDVQFFRPVSVYAEEMLSCHDLAFQNDYLAGACMGFFFVRNKSWVREMFHRSLSLIERCNGEQPAVNQMLAGREDLFRLLPEEFFTVGKFGKAWEGEDFSIPENLVIHHANWTVGVEQKLKLLQLVRQKYNSQHEPQRRTKKRNPGRRKQARPRRSRSTADC